MNHHITLIIVMYVSYLSTVVLCKKGDVLVFTGCNATLQWNLGNISSHPQTIKILVMDTSGNIIAKANKDDCSNENNPSMKCGVTAHENELSLSLIIINASANHSGNYTVWYKERTTAVNITKKLVVLASTSSGSNKGNNFTQHDINGLPLKLLGVGLVIVAACLIIFGILYFVSFRHKFASRRLGSRTMDQPSAGTPNRDVPRGLLNIESHSIPITVPPVQVNACLGIRRSGCFCLTDNLTSLEGSANGIRLEELSSRVQNNRNVGNDEQNTGAGFLSMNNFRPENLEPQTNADEYNTIDEARLSAYQWGRANKNGDNLQEDRKNTEDRNNYYDYATLPGLYKSRNAL